MDNTHELWTTPWEELSDEVRGQLAKSGWWNKERHDAQRLERESIEICGSMEPRVCNTADLVEITLAGNREDFNRQFDAEAIQQHADPNGNHVLKPFMVHRHKFPDVAEPHMRCMVWIKVSGKQEPVQATLDVQMEQFHALPTVTEAKKKLGLPVGEYEGEWGTFVQQFWQTVTEGEVEGPQSVEAVLS